MEKLSKAFGIPIREFIATIIKKELKWILKQISQGNYEFIQDFYKGSVFESALIEYHKNKF